MNVSSFSQFKKFYEGKDLNMKQTNFDNLNTTKEIKDQLVTMSQSPMCYNMLHLVPSSCTWNLTLQEIENHALGIARKFLGDDVKMVTIHNRKSTREPRCVVWLPSNSRHLYDDNANGSNQVLTPKVQRFSKELKDFAAQFAPSYDDEGRYINEKRRIIIVNDKNEHRDANGIVGIIISINNVLLRLFDADNRGFIDTFGTSARNKKCMIRCTILYSGGNEERRQMIGIRVTKSVSDEGTRRHRPIPNFRDGE